MSNPIVTVMLVDGDRPARQIVSYRWPQTKDKSFMCAIKLAKALRADLKKCGFKNHDCYVDVEPLNE